MKRLFKNRKIRIAVLAFVAVALCAILIATLVTDSISRRREEEKLAQFDIETQELRGRMQELQIAYSNIEQYLLDTIEYGSYVGVVYTELDPQLYDTVFNMCNYRHDDGSEREVPIVGFMALYDGNMPGDEGLVSRLHFDIMVESGWHYVLYWDGESNLTEYITEMKARFLLEGLEFPKTIMFASRAYDVEYDDYLLSVGFTNVIHHGEDRLAIVEKTVDSKMWHPGIIGWNTRGQSKIMLDEIVTRGGIGFFEVSFTKNDGEFLFDKDQGPRTAAYGRMLDTMEDLILSSDLEILDFDLAKEGRVKYLAAMDEVLKQIEAERIVLDKEIKALEKQINDIYLEKYKD